MCFLGEVEWVDWNIVVVEVWIWEIGCEIKWFGCCGINYFENVNVYFVGDDFYFVYEVDID